MTSRPFPEAPQNVPFTSHGLQWPPRPVPKPTDRGRCRPRGRSALGHKEETGPGPGARWSRDQVTEPGRGESKDSHWEAEVAPGDQTEMCTKMEGREDPRRTQEPKKGPSLQSKQAEHLPGTTGAGKNSTPSPSPLASEQKREKTGSYLRNGTSPALGSGVVHVAPVPEAAERHLGGVLRDNLAPRKFISTQVPFEHEGDWKLFGDIQKLGPQTYRPVCGLQQAAG